MKVRGLLAGAVGLLVWLATPTLALADASYLGDQCIANALASGTPDVITIPLLPCSTNTNLLLLTASGANTTTTPTLQQIGGTPALTIVKANGSPLAVGDIPSAGYIALLTSTGVNWVLMNPASGGGGSGSLTVTDGTHTVAGTTTERFTNSMVGGTTPNATVAVPVGIMLSDGTHAVSAATAVAVTGGVVGGVSPNATLLITGAGQTYTDGTHTVVAAGQLTVTGGTIGGTTPNATLTITPGPVGVTFADGTHTVANATQLTATGLTIGGTSPNATIVPNYAANADVWTHTSTTTVLNPAVAATSIAPQTFTESGGTFSVNFNSGINLELPLVHADCPCTIANPTNVYAGLSGNMTIVQSSTGSDTVGTWGTTWKFSGGVKPTLSAGANAVDVLPFYCRTTTFCVVTFVANAQ